MKTQFLFNLKKQKPKLIEGRVGKLLFKLTLPMIVGIFSMIVFNLTDTYFVAKLGITNLAALSFTFPVILTINNLAIGIAIGASAVISKAVGNGDINLVRRLTTNSLLLAVIFVLIIVIIGLSTIKPIFILLGAKADTMPLIMDYMKIWYIGVIFVIVPMVGNNAIRALGDTLTPGVIMIIAASINIILDPLLIFGIGIFPRLGIKGAAIATVIARASALVVSLLFLHFRDRLITRHLKSFQEILNAWKKILFIGLPTAATRIAVPLSQGFITRILSTFGHNTVAGFGVATRIEFFALTAPLALSAIIGPFIGQNWGAGKIQRVKESIRVSEKFSIIFGIIMYIFLFIVAEPIALLFNKNPKIVSIIVLYLRIVPIGYCFQGILLLTTAGIIVLHKPYRSLFIIVFQMIILYIPLAYFASLRYGTVGVFSALTIVYLLGGFISHFAITKLINRDLIKS